MEKNVLALEDILHLTSLREVFGGFAHEIAQPLNAIMIASQVIQLKLDRTLLTDDEKGFLKQRLNLVTSQVQRATEIIESLRLFSRENSHGTQRSGIEGIFRKIHGLMGQQFMGRGIDLVWNCHEKLPTRCENVHLIEGVIVQALAVARNCVTTLGAWHEDKAIPYNRSVSVDLLRENDASRMRITWDIGQFPTPHDLADFTKHAGFVTATSVVASLGGRLHYSVSELTIDFP
ncbi:MAG TPA: histidine kinase dimerization/phospho-acceptor domain-containing protein [Desulfomonilaceae bacterium]|nr:histidine kinase dimerization/phospho-acceptor domain-containing protein [Desulfomonilaceae bacterium]